MEKVLKFLRSIKLTLVLLILLIIVSLIGIIIPQGLSVEQYSKKWGSLFGSIIMAAGIDRLFSTTWFYILLGFFSLNIMVCSIGKLISDIKEMFAFSFIKSSGDYGKMVYNQSFTSNKSNDDLKKLVNKFFTKNFYSHSTKETEKEIQFCGKRGRLRYVGSFLLHFSFISLLTGGLYGKLKGFSYIQKFDRGNIVRVRDRSFSLRCDWFKIETNEQGKLKDYLSKLSIIDSDMSKIKDKIVEVNSPLTYQGIKMYQSSYSIDNNTIEIAQLEITGPGLGKDGYVGLFPFKSEEKIPGTDITVYLDNFFCDFAIDIKSKSYGNRSERHVNPAIQVILKRKDEVLYKHWVFNRFKRTHGKDEAYQVSFLNYKPMYSTGIQIKYNPGIPFIWFGIICMSLGICMVFFIRKKIIWISVVKKSNSQDTIYIGAVPGGGPEDFKEEFLSMCDSLKSVL